MVDNLFIPIIGYKVSSGSSPNYSLYSLLTKVQSGLWLSQFGVVRLGSGPWEISVPAFPTNLGWVVVGHGLQAIMF